jgi:hypothetical protein
MEYGAHEWDSNSRREEEAWSPGMRFKFNEAWSSGMRFKFKDYGAQEMRFKFKIQEEERAWSSEMRFKFKKRRRSMELGNEIQIQEKEKKHGARK